MAPKWLTQPPVLQVLMLFRRFIPTDLIFVGAGILYLPGCIVAEEGFEPSTNGL